MTIGINKRSTAAYFKHESTVGTAVTPTTATDGYMAISADYSSEYTKEVLESDLLTPSIGLKKGQSGLTTTGGSVSVEFKGSNVEGQAPEFMNILESLMGDKNVASTEYDCVAGSTTTSINVDTGEGANFNVGDILLVKHAAHPYEVRAIKSIVGDALTIEPALNFAPVATTTLGKCISFPAANSGHKHGTLGLYHGNEVSEKIAGCLVGQMTLDVNVGQIVKAAFTLNGLNNTRAIGAAPHTPTYDASNGVVGLAVEAYMGADMVHFPSCSINITNDIAELMSAKEVSGKISSRPSKRTVEVTMAQYLDNAVLGNQTLFNNMTDFAFLLVAGKKDGTGNWEAGKTWAVYMPRCYFTNAPFGDENDILKEDLTFRAHIGSGLPEVFINFI